MKKILIYGTGDIGKAYYKEICANNEITKEYFLIGFLDTDRKKEGHEIFGKRIFHITNLDVEYDEIHIAISYKEVYFYLLENGVDPSKIVIASSHIAMYFLERSLVENFPKSGFELDYAITQKNIYAKDVGKIYKERLDFEFDKYHDYCRYKTAELLADQINGENVEGSVAELGVFQGDFSTIINKLYPNRNLYLFDTFEGFSDIELKKELKNNLIISENVANKASTLFKDTSVEMILSRMKYPQNCIVKKGIFPSSASEVEDKFAFVSLDVDLSLPLLAGLEYFYPRLSSGGFIMVHDYNSNEWAGARKAVSEYEKKVGRLYKVPIADRSGTIIITK